MKLLQEPSTTYYLPVLIWPLRKKIYYVNKNKRRDSYELGQQHRQLKTMKMNNDVYDKGHKHQFQPGSNQKKMEAAAEAPKDRTYPSLEHLLDD